MQTHPIIVNDQINFFKQSKIRDLKLSVQTNPQELDIKNKKHQLSIIFFYIRQKTSS